MVLLSTHDLTQRSTSILFSTPSITVIFQLTTSRRGRPNLIRPGIRSACLSTHDLTQRSTEQDRKAPCKWFPFNSRPHAEVDAVIFRVCTALCLSTHDLTQRSTEQDRKAPCKWFPFNSRPHAEVDGIFPAISDAGKSFNSRPHAEVDHLTPVEIYLPVPFQLTTSRRGRP